MVKYLDITQDEVEEMCRELYLNFGTTLAGLIARGYKVDYDHWHDTVHGTLAYEDLLKPDPKLKQLLDSINLPKWIFTNADRKHAVKCLDLLGLSDCFQGIICFETIMEEAAESGVAHNGRPVVCKPNRTAMDLALKQAGGLSPLQVAFFDDSTRNIASAYHLGVYSCLIGRTGMHFDSAHIQLKSMHDLPSHMPWLWHLDCPERSPLGSPKEGEEHRTAVYVQA